MSSKRKGRVLMPIIRTRRRQLSSLSAGRFFGRANKRSHRAPNSRRVVNHTRVKKGVNDSSDPVSEGKSLLSMTRPERVANRRKTLRERHQSHYPSRSPHPKRVRIAFAPARRVKRNGRHATDLLSVVTCQSARPSCTDTARSTSQRRRRRQEGRGQVVLASA